MIHSNWIVWLSVAFVVSSFCALGIHAACLALECGPPSQWMPLLAPFVTIGALVVGYYIWIDQTKLKRRFEVAEKAMLTFLAAKDILAHARLDMSYSGEADDRPKEPNESPQEARIKDRWYMPLKRLSAGWDELRKLREAEMLCALYLGTEAKAAVAEMQSVIQAVRASAQMLIMTAHDAVYIDALPSESADSLIKQIKEWEANCSSLVVRFGANQKPIAASNQISARIEQAEARLRKACAPYVRTAEL
jgi:hypothetical protein